MRHYVLTRSAYGPAWTDDANRRRLEVTRAVTAALMAAQTCRDWTWVVALDPTDPLLDERMAVYEAAAPRFVPLIWSPPEVPKGATWDRHRNTATKVQRIAASAYKAPWRGVMGDADERILQTRLDDDDGLAPDAMERYQAASRRIVRRTILMLPKGVRVWHGHYADVEHKRNAMHTLVTPPGDTRTVYDYGHATCNKAAPIVMVDQRWGWLWVRHRDTISGHKLASLPIDDAVRTAFPIDWPALRAAWA